MPELPEVETVRGSLERRVVGQKISSLAVGDYPLVLGGEDSAVVQANLAGRTIVALRRRAKYLIFDLDDGTALTVHLRMTGRLSAVPHGRAPLRFQRLSIAFESGLDLRFSDQRKFGRVVHLSPDDAKRLDERLGKEPLAADFTAEWLHGRLQRRPGKIKAVLLDQKLVAGLGNIYADEALFVAGIHPARVANSLDQLEVRRLHRHVRAVLRAAIQRKGTTFSSFEDADGNQGEYGGALRVYGRGGKGRCPRCGALLERTVVGGRGTSFCPSCQPLSPPPLISPNE
jgi:formamidopyrimidine-DNA glycosylase